MQIAVSAGTGPQHRLSYAVTGPTPQGSRFDAVGGWFRWTPSEDQGPANYPLSVRVNVENDDDLSAETTLWIQVREVNSAPSIEPHPSKPPLQARN